RPYLQLYIQERAFCHHEDMVGHKLGEFAPTRTYRGHDKSDKTSKVK
ncbi:MAG TPA: hypothetical protein DIV40_11270, partial [Clostridiales bacterium]|nr:hypothetical protein [Clostridiales bacterium]